MHKQRQRIVRLESISRFAKHDAKEAAATQAERSAEPSVDFGCVCHQCTRVRAHAEVRCRSCEQTKPASAFNDHYVRLRRGANSRARDPFSPLA